MWSDSFIDEVSSELSQANFSTHYQLFGSLGEQPPQNYVTGQAMSQPFDGNLLPPQPHFQYEAWSHSTEQNEQMDYAFHGASGCTVMWHTPGMNNEQTFSTAQPEFTPANTNGNCRFESKSMVLNKIQCLRSEHVSLDEQIEEQKRRNSLLMKQIADARAQLNTMQQNTEILYDEYHSLGETSEKYSKQLEGQEKKLKESVSKKRAEITEIKVDAQMVTVLRDDRDQVAAEIARLRSDLIDAEIDVSNMTEKFQYELGIMVLFPFWKLEEEMDRLLGVANCRVGGESEERDDDDDDGDSSEEEESTSSSSESSAESLGETFQENSSENSKESLEANTGVRFDRSQTTSIDSPSVNDESIPSVSPSICSSSPSANECGVKTGDDYDDFIVDESFAQTAAPKKQKKKIRKFTRLARCLRRLCCIPQGRKEDQ